MRAVPTNGVVPPTPNGQALRDTIADYRLECRARRVGTKTLRWYEQKLGVVCDLLVARGVTDPASLTLPHLHHVLETLDDGSRSSYTIHGYAQVIKGWLHYLEDEQLVDVRTRARLKLPRVKKRLIKTLSETEVAALFDATRLETGAWLRMRDRAILHVLLETGVRASELLTLRRCDINLDDDPHVRVLGKGDKEREVGPLSLDCVRACRRYLRAVGSSSASGSAWDDTSAFFLSRYRHPLTVSGLDQMLYRLRDAAGLGAGEQEAGAEVRAHVFRHRYALTKIGEGMDIHRLAQLMGHSSVVVTEGYLRDYQQRNARRPVATSDSQWRS